VFGVGLLYFDVGIGCVFCVFVECYELGVCGGVVDGGFMCVELV